MSDKDRVASDIVEKIRQLERGLTDALEYIERLKAIRSELKVKNGLFSENLKHLKKSGTIASVSEFARVKKFYSDNKKELETIEDDIGRLEAAAEKQKQNLSRAKVLYKEYVERLPEKGKVLVFKK